MVFDNIDEFDENHRAAVRNGTTYLLYAHGVRGKMLQMIDLWINNNYCLQRWRVEKKGGCHMRGQWKGSQR